LLVLFVFGFEARELLISLESFIDAMCEMERTSLAGIVSLGRGYFIMRSQGLRKNLSLITRGLRLDSLPSDGTNPTNLI